MALAAYTVSETEQAIIVQFGRPVGGVVIEPGLHFRLPIIQTVHRFDKRWLEYDGDATEIPTKDKKYIWVDTYARWRIADPLRFYQAVRDEQGGQSRLDDIVDGETRNAVASYDLIEIVRSSNRPFEITEDLEGIGAAEAMAKIVTGRQKIAAQILEKAAKITPEFGIELVDVRFKRINYVDSVQQKVFDRMISGASGSRSAAVRKARTRCRDPGQKERDVLAASSVGYKSAQETREADAKAVAIYAGAYGRDPEFYQFVKSMETLLTGLGKDTTLVLSTDSELMKYLSRDAGGR